MTPYMHTLAYHVPHFVKLYGNIKQFSGQGNYSSLPAFVITIVYDYSEELKRIISMPNLNDPLNEALKAEGQLDYTFSFKRQKKPYNKKMQDEDQSKRQRTATDS